MKQIQELWFKIGRYYDRILNDEQIKMYAEDCQQYSIEQLLDAFHVYRRNPYNQKVPLPSQLITIINPDESQKEAAQEAVSRIWQAIGQFGYTNPSGAREFVGELGWAVVTRMGGWNSLCCEQATIRDAGIIRAQMRDLAVAIYDRTKAGRVDPPRLPEQRENNLVPIGAIFQRSKFLDHIEKK